MNKKVIQLLLVSILFIIVLFFIKTNQKSTINKELKDFAVEDTATINKIFLVDKQNNSILLEKKEEYWLVNKESIARQDLVNILLKTILRIRVKEPVPKAAKENIIKNLAVKSTKVEIYKNNKLIRTFYVGGPTMDYYGTYMILEHSKAPFIMEIPGFRGYLSTRFTTKLTDWISQMVFNVKLNKITSITVENNKNKKESFKIVQHKNNIELFNYNGNRINKFDTSKVIIYLKEFQKKNFSKYVEDIPKTWKDSIVNSTPMYIIKLENIDGEKQQIKAFSKPAWGKVDFFGDVLKTDPDNFFLLLNNGDFVYAQYFSFNPIFKKISDFVE